MYNFDEIIDRRNTNALNTDGFRGYIFHAGPEKVFPYKDEEFVRMWVADMEFAVAPEILDELRKRIDRRIFGYTGVYTSEYYESFRKWCLDHYDWDFPQEQLCYSPGIIPALYQLTETLCADNEKILLNTPAYGYFLHAAEYSNISLLLSPLKKNEAGEFFIDFDNFESNCANPKCKMVFWCNPHNPTGRIWTKEELTKVAEIVKKYNLWIISDEIHCDLTRQGMKHTPMAKIMPDYPKLITCMAPSKTFNLAGLAFSNIIIRDPATREEFKSRDKLFGMVNPMSLTAAKAAYDKGGAWHEALKKYLDENFHFTKDFLNENLPKAVMNISEATYLAWVDLSRCLPDVEDLPGFFANNAGVLLEGGNDLFVGNAAGYIRLNLAMPRSIIKTGLERMRDAINTHNHR
ncbi:MAG TPA: aminotransferase class I/II-fold pyridoxal phosphate-dependent enzyme [Candidatus Lachnoclostridium stercoravium]|uniref:cysteine-S-conjugate beta-lyase n=1 Tax=Candidatus Lachnoclostridium stercoravium TaxID=2838633 RepID=A0A9D2HF47_9FIRM|nr:aminotransferase class I/II-fold pyridoxal phosphate-dependent enzyme [Candidatus Lachnoclostridium stercoravium]